MVRFLSSRLGKRAESNKSTSDTGEDVATAGSQGRHGETDSDMTDSRTGAVVGGATESVHGSDSPAGLVENTESPDQKKSASATVEEGQENEKSSDDSPADDESRYMSGAKLALLTVGLCLATFVVALDNTIIATAIPRITTDFDSLDDVGWYASAYLLTTTSLQPPFGKVITYFSVKWVYLSAVLIFELGSILCAAAVNSKMLIVGRAVAGVGAAALFSGGMTIVGLSVPLRKRAIYLAMLSSMFGISSVVGPILGGVLTDQASWRWCFWINLPFGGAACFAVAFFFAEPKRQHTNLTIRQKLHQIDFLGAFVLIAAICCLLLALQWGGTLYPWSDSRVYGCIIGFGILIICFCTIQVLLKERATMPPRIICRQRTVACCALFSAFLAMALYTHIYYLPFYFQAVKGTSAEGSGIHCIPYLVSITIASIVVGGLITTLGPFVPFMWTGVVIFNVGCGLLYTLKPDSSVGQWIGYEVLAGVGAGACVQIPFIAVQVVLDDKDMPIGNAVAIFFNTLGGAISVSVAENIFTNTITQQLTKNVPTISPAAVLAAGPTHFRDTLPKADILGVVMAYNSAVTTAFILPIACAGLAFLASLGMEWKSVKGHKLSMGGGAA